jgi:3-oxoacyl-[acyl-carrier-protein] synthase III
MIAHGSSEPRTIKAAIRNTLAMCVRTRTRPLWSGSPSWPPSERRCPRDDPQSLHRRLDRRIGSALPEHRLTNADLMKVMETSADWIVQRTGIHERRRHDHDSPYPTSDLAARSLDAALKNAGMKASELGLILCATMTPDSPTPAVSCRVAAALGCGHIGAMDINAACSGFVFALSTSARPDRRGAVRVGPVIGVDTVTRQFWTTQPTGRGAAILFGDGAGAFVLRRTPDTAQRHARPGHALRRRRGQEPLHPLRPQADARG